MRDCLIEPRNFIPPSAYDVLLSDVHFDDLVGPIAERLEVGYLSEAIQPASQKHVRGVLYGTNMRPMVNLVVSTKRFKKLVNVIFLVDTGSPCLYLCEQAMEALGFKDNMPETFEMMFEGVPYEAVMSPKTGHYHDINLIGASFLSLTHACVTVDYLEKIVDVDFQSL